MEKGSEWRGGRARGPRAGGGGGGGGARKNMFPPGAETIDIGGGLLYYTDGLGCFPGCFCYENAVRLIDAGLFWL